MLFVLLNSLMGMAFGALLHNTAAAIVIFYVLPTAWTLLAMGALDRLRAWLDTMQTFGWVLAGHWDGHLSQILTSTAVWVSARWRSAWSAPSAARWHSQQASRGPDAVASGPQRRRPRR